MSSQWACAPEGQQEIVERESTWSQQVEDVCSGKYEIHVDGNTQEKKRPNELYLENAAAIAFLLVEQILTEKTNENVIDIDTVTVTIETSESPRDKETHGSSTGGDKNESCVIKFVTFVLYCNPHRQSSFFQSLAKVLMKLFTRQEFLPELENIFSHNSGTSFGEGGDTDDAAFESDMMRAMSILDNKNEGESKFEQRQKQIRPSMESKCFSSIHIQYPTLPSSICRLLSDLIEGPLRTKTSFASLHDVLDDLEQMVKEPDIFLHETIGADTKLDFGAKLYGRKQEVSQIIGIANNITSKRETGPLEIVTIGGYSGAGKSCLVRKVGRYLSRKGWFYTQGKFDRMRQSDAFSVITSAFESFCDTMQAMKEKGDQGDDDYCTRVRAAVLEAIGDTGVHYLSQMIPSLQKIMDLDSNINDDTNGESHLNPKLTGKEALMSQRRREYLFSAFVEAVSSVGRPILIFYDDVQWADASALEFLQKMLMHIAARNTPRRNIMFCVAYRDDELKETDLLRRVTSGIESYDSVNITKIKLGGLSKRTLNNILSPVLSLPRRITSPLSEVIYQKTTGNIFFVIEFLKTLESPNKNILTYSLAKRRWMWDTGCIAMIPISDNVVGLLVKKLRSIEKTVLDSLIIASCFGSQVDLSVVTLLSGMKRIFDIGANLCVAVDEGVLEKAGPLFMFAHDSIQQSVYEVTPKSELVQLHVRIGLMLISKGAFAPRSMQDDIFTIAVSHINMALPKSVGDCAAVEFTPSQSIASANLNLTAGQKAVNGKSDFAQAEVHFKSGISFLPNNSWENHYHLTLELFNEYANVLFVQHNLDELQSHIDIILKNAKCLEDKIKAHELMISALSWKGSAKGAMDHATLVLDLLGFTFLLSTTSERVSEIVSSLRSMTETFTADHLRIFPLMTDQVALQAMKIMSAFHMQLSFSSTTMIQMLACQMLQLTIKHGLCVESAEAFANFGYCLVTVFHNYEDGYRMGKLSLIILDRFKATNRVAKVYYLVYGFLAVWKEPLHATIEGLKYAAHIGLVEGDCKYTRFNQMMMFRLMFMAGCNLSEVRDGLLQLCLDMLYERSKKTAVPGFNSSLGILYMIVSLAGKSQDEMKICSTFCLSREENEKELLEQYAATNNASNVQIIYMQRLVKSFWFRDYDTAMDCCKKYESHTKTVHLVRPPDIMRSLYFGLSSLILSRRRNEEELITRGREILLKMRGWAKINNWYIENKALLLEAEYSYSKGETEKAKAAYEKSIQSAHKHNLIHEEALAYELFGIFYTEGGRPSKGNELLKIAHGLYLQWGARKKAKQIFEE